MSARASMTGFLACDQQLSVRIPLAVHQRLTHPLRYTSNPGTPATTSAGVSYRRRFIPAAGRRGELGGCLVVFSPTAGSRLSARLCEPSDLSGLSLSQSVSQCAAPAPRPAAILVVMGTRRACGRARARPTARERSHTRTDSRLVLHASL